MRLALRVSDLRKAAVDHQLDAVDVAGIVRGQEQGRGGDLVGAGHIAQRHDGGDMFGERLDLRFVHLQAVVHQRGAGEAGAQHVAADLPALETVKSTFLVVSQRLPKKADLARYPKFKGLGVSPWFWVWPVMP